MSTTSTKNDLHVLVVGAGLGGLCLAQGLKRAGMTVSVFERDPTQHFRPQGYRIRVDANGADALRACLDAAQWSLFEATCAKAPEGLGAALDAATGEPLADWARPPKREGQSYTVDRTLLRGLLMLGLEDCLHFGKHFSRYTLSADGSKVTAHFAGGSEATGDLLVGADGWRSGVRRQLLPEHVPVDTEGRCIYGKTLITPELLERFPTSALQGMSLVRAVSQSLSLILEPVRFAVDPAEASGGRLPSVEDYMYWVLVGRRGNFTSQDLGEDQAGAPAHKPAVEQSLQLTQSWHPSVRALLELQAVEQAAALRLCSFAPELPRWSPSARVTLLGDAVHVMSPTGGVGANTALQDAARLCARLATGGATEETIGSYEEDMRERARKAIEGSYFGGKKLYDQPPFAECRPVQL